jgi:acyl-CoA synthetase (AMP-forming)/AMP-acid ligase II
MVILVSKWLAEKYSKEGWWDNRTLVGTFLDNVSKNQDRTAIVDPPNKEDLVGIKPERINYRELNERVDRLSSFFLRKGLVKDGVVIIQLPNINELLTTYLAVWRLGGIISPVPMQWRAHELVSVVETTKAWAYVSTKFKDFDHLDMVKNLRTENSPITNLFSLAEIRNAMINEPVSPDLDSLTDSIQGDDVAVVEWTSGTEKEPKACPMSHNNWGFLRFFYRSEFKGGILSDGAVIMNPAPLVNMTGIGVGIVPWLMVAGTFVLHHPFDPVLYLRQLVSEKVNFTLAPPAVAVAMLKHPDVDKFDLSATEFFVQGSAPPPPWTFLEFKKRWGIESINVWGQNEGTGLFSTKDTVHDLSDRARSFPWPGPGKMADIPFFKATETKIVDPNTGREVTEMGSVGELCFRSPFTIPEYYNQPDLTRDAFDKDGFFHTGDLFTIVSNDRIAFFDRLKDIIIRGGFNISSAEIEDIAKRDPRIVDAAAVPLPDEVLGERVCLFVVPKAGENVGLEDVKAIMKKNEVAIYKWPERVETITSIPRNPVGKAQKDELRKKLTQSP